MTIRQTIKISTALSALTIAMIGGAASAQSIYDGSSGDEPIQEIILGDSTTTTTGDSTVPPFQTLVTTVQDQFVNSVTVDTLTAVGPLTINGIDYTGFKIVSGTGTQARTSTTTLLQTFDPGPPPTLISSVPGGPTFANVGAPLVTEVVAEGEAGNVVESYGSVLRTPNPTAVDANGSVVVVENAYITTTEGIPQTGGAAGVVYSQTVGTATYDPSTGLVTVALPSAPTSQTVVSSSGITTTGTISAAGGLTTTGNITANTVNAQIINANTGGLLGATSINAGNGKIVNVSNGTASGDAVNFGQLNALAASTTASLAALNTDLNNKINLANDQAAAGTAVAVALSGGYMLPNKKFNVEVNYGNYEGESAIAGNLVFLASEQFAINGGIATSFSDRGGTAFRVGGTFGF